MWIIRKTVSKGDYVYALVPDHPKRTKNNYVLLHRIVLENYLGRMLEDDEIAHHINEDKKNNGIDNIELCLAKVHNQYHAKRGSKMVKLKCPQCKAIFHLHHLEEYLEHATNCPICDFKIKK